VPPELRPVSVQLPTDVKEVAVNSDTPSLAHHRLRSGPFCGTPNHEVQLRKSSNAHSEGIKANISSTLGGSVSEPVIF